MKLEVVTEPPEGLKLNIKQLEAQHPTLDNSFGGTIPGGQIQSNACDLWLQGPMQRSLMQIWMLVGLLFSYVFLIQKTIPCVSFCHGREAGNVCNT